MNKPVLVVDDDEAVRIVTTEMLKRLECDVTCADGGPQALALLQDSQFDIIFLDVGMPSMSGIEVYAKVRESLPEQKIVFMTGYSEEDITDLGNANTWILPKPFTLNALREVVNAVFD